MVKSFQKAVFLLMMASLVVFAGVLPVNAVAPTTPTLAPQVNNQSTYGANKTTWDTYALFNADITDIPSLIAKGVNFVLGFLGIIAVILILVSGWQWMVAESEDKVKEARKRLINSVIGLAIIALAWVIGFAIIKTLTTITGS